MERYITDDTTLTEIADAIRESQNETGSISFPDEYIESSGTAWYQTKNTTSFFESTIANAVSFIHMGTSYSNKFNKKIKFKINSISDYDNIWISFNNLASYSDSFNPQYSRPTALSNSNVISNSYSVGGFFVPAFESVDSQETQNINDVIIQIVIKKSVNQNMADIKDLVITTHKYGRVIQYFYHDIANALYISTSDNVVELKKDNSIYINGTQINGQTKCMRYDKSVKDLNNNHQMFLYVNNNSKSFLQNFTEPGNNVNLYDYVVGTFTPNTLNIGFWSGDTNGWCSNKADVLNSPGTGIPEDSVTIGQHLTVTNLDNLYGSPSTEISNLNLFSQNVYTNPCFGWSSLNIASTSIDIIKL